MNLDKYVKTKDFVHTCPFCNEPLGVSNNPQYKTNAQVGYECAKCCIPDAKTKSGRPYSRYYRAIMENVDLGNGNTFDQVIINETFYMPHTDNRWYNVHNDLVKNQTAMVLTRPATKEDIYYEDEKDGPLGLVWVGNLILLPFIDSWNLADQEGTISKIQTYILFL
jgi:hypothetical protein